MEEYSVHLKEITFFNCLHINIYAINIRNSEKKIAMIL